jgi:ABC-type multidrug transport system ATPase subunit
MSHLDIQSISISQGKRLLIENGSFSIQTGDILAIQGKNGCGKSTLLKSLFGTHKAKQLEWSMNGEKLPAPSPKYERIALLPQDSFLPRDLTPGEIIAMMYKSHDLQKPLHSLPYVADYALKRLSELSHGAARYIEIIVIMNLWHPFILLDEPFSLLAPLHKVAVKKLIQEKSETKGIVIVDHYTDDIDEIATKKLWIENGQLDHRKVAEDTE